MSVRGRLSRTRQRGLDYGPVVDAVAFLPQTPHEEDVYEHRPVAMPLHLRERPAEPGYHPTDFFFQPLVWGRQNLGRHDTILKRQGVE